jgi:flagellar basal body-associated protein FliL
VCNIFLIIVVILKKKKMKKKLIGLLVFLVAMVGVMYFMGVFTSGEATEEDHSQGEETNSAVEESQTREKIEETMPNFEDTTELDLGLDEEEFDPEAQL